VSSLQFSRFENTLLELAYGGITAAITSSVIPLNTWVWVSTYSQSVNSYVTAYLNIWTAPLLPDQG